MAPSPPVAAKTPRGLLKKVPPWGWAIGAGGVLGLGYTLYRNRRTATAIDGAPAGEADLAADGVDYQFAAQPSPGGAYYPAAGVSDVSAETVGAVGQTAVESVIGGITGVVETIPALLAAVPQSEWGPEGVASLIAAMPQAPAPQAVPISTPAAPPAAKPPTGVTILGRTFPNALSYKELSNPGIGRTFDVKFHGRTERWETWDAERRPVGGTFGNAKPKYKTVQIQRKWKKISSRNN